MKWRGREDLVLGKTLEPLGVLVHMYKNRYGTVLILVSMFGGCIGRDNGKIRWECGSIYSKRKSMKWSGKVDLVLGRGLKPLGFLINMYKNRYGTDLILVSMICWEHHGSIIYIQDAKVNEVMEL
jgi:hypothetical protein